MRRQRDNSELLSGSILKHVFRLALPMIVAFMFVTSYHFIDRYFVSQLGDVATAAIGMAFIVQMVVIAIGVGVGSGVNSYIARNLGAGDEETAKSTVKHAFYLAAGIGTVLGIAGLILQKPLFRMLGAEGELLELIVAYLTIIFIFTPV
ncbi:MAG: MATE family efflux transporter, partial [Calditrichaeota bacterium]|nr:MATE family efflux transporter [Calditrichota bacterium]